MVFSGWQVGGAAAAAVDVDELLSCDIHHWDVQLELAGSKLQVV